MSERKMTLPEWHLFLEEKFQDVPRESIRFLSLEALPRLMHALDNHRHLHPDCALHYDKLLSMIIDAPGWLKHNSPEALIFQKELHAATRMLSLQHRIYPRGLWLSRFTTLGIIAGAAAAFILYSFTDIDKLSGLLFTGAAAGMMLGWILGKIKEHQLKKEGKLY